MFLAILRQCNVERAPGADSDLWVAAGGTLLPSPQTPAPTGAKPRRGPMTDLAINVLYDGDNLDLLRR